MTPVTEPPELRVCSAGLSDVGRARSNNEDAFIAEPALGLYAVADGMGGHAAGEVASQIAVETVRRAAAAVPDAAFLREPSLEHRRVLLDWLAGVVDAANRAIRARADEDPRLRSMGCTLDVALVRGSGLFLAHVGDSRTYVMRAGDLYPLTEDHTLGQALLASGTMSAAEVAANPQKNVLMRALGPYPRVQVDTAYFELAAGDVLLLCSDGLYNEVPHDHLRALLDGVPSRAARALIQAALDAGGRDNVTAVVFAVEESGFTAPAVLGCEATRATLARSPLFAALTPAEMVRVQRIAYARELAPGEELYAQGQLWHELYVLVSGQLTAWRDGLRAGEVGPGDPGGALDLSDGSPSPVTVRAEVPSRVLVFPLADIQGLMANDAAIAVKLTTAALARVAQRLRTLVDVVSRYRRIHGELSPILD